MAGMFGTLGRALSNPNSLAMIGATLRDVGASINGEAGNNVLLTQKMLQERQQKAAQEAFRKKLGGLIGGAPVGGGFVDPSLQTQDPQVAAMKGNPAITGINGGAQRLNANSPELAQIAMEAQAAGYNMDDILKVLQMQQPSVQYDRGFGYNAKTGERSGGYHPELGQGETPLFDAQGNVVAIRNIDGSVQAAAERAGAIKGAEARAQAPYTFQTVQGPDGAPVVVSNQTAAALGSNGGIIARGQSPAAASAAKIQGDAAAQAGVSLPGSLATAESTLQVINELRNHPGRKFGTGGTGIIPAMPGTATKDFVTLLDQAKGKTFLEAFASLKGGGQITEREGAAAQSAIARLDRAQSEEGFLKALSDLEGIVRGSMSRSQQAAGRPSGGGYQVAPAAGQRQAGATYQTPRGPMKWTGTGWLPAN